MRSLRFATLLWCTVLCLLLSCSRSEEIIPSLAILSNGTSISNTSISFDSKGGNATIDIHSNVRWQIGCAAEWVTITPREGQGNGTVVLAVDAASAARSAVVVVNLSDYSQVRHTFNIIQYAPDAEPQPDNGEDTPTENPDNNEDEDDNEEENSGDGEQNKEDSEGENDTPSEDGGEEDNDSSAGDNDDHESNSPSEDDSPNNNNGEGDSTPSTPPAGDDSEQEDDTPKEYSRITTIAQLAAGSYYLGGYQATTLHLAIAGISNGHCHTAPYLYDNESGSLTPEQSAQAIKVTLEAAEGANTYYIHFDGEGYLYATSNSAGKLTFSEEPQRAWRFTAGEDGFVVTQDDSLYVKLVIATYATDRVLRSIDGYEEGNPIVLFRKN